VPGQRIVIPDNLTQVQGRAQDLDRLRRSYLKNAAKVLDPAAWTDTDVDYVAAETNSTREWVLANVPTTEGS